MKTKNWKPLLPIGLAILSILACTLNVGGPPYPSSTIPVSTEAAGQLLAEIEQAVALGEASGQMQLVFNESGLSSLLNYYLEEQEQPIFTNPQVFLQDNQIRIHGTAQQGILQAYIYIEMTAGADSQGGLSLAITSVDFGPLPVPDGLLSALTAGITEAYTGALGPVATGFRIEQVVIADGIMILSGRTR